jgi:hypothetical protein
MAWACKQRGLKEEIIMAQETSEKGRYADIHGLSMYYEIHGEGQPLVLPHGALSALLYNLPHKNAPSSRAYAFLSFLAPAALVIKLLRFLRAIRPQKTQQFITDKNKSFLD